MQLLLVIGIATNNHISAMFPQAARRSITPATMGRYISSAPRSTYQRMYSYFTKKTQPTPSLWSTASVYKTAHTTSMPQPVAQTSWRSFFSKLFGFGQEADQRAKNLWTFFETTLKNPIRFNDHDINYLISFQSIINTPNTNNQTILNALMQEYLVKLRTSPINPPIMHNMLNAIDILLAMGARLGLKIEEALFELIQLKLNVPITPYNKPFIEELEHRLYVTAHLSKIDYDLFKLEIKLVKSQKVKSTQPPKTKTAEKPFEAQKPEEPIKQEAAKTTFTQQKSEEAINKNEKKLLVNDLWQFFKTYLLETDWYPQVGGLRELTLKNFASVINEPNPLSENKYQTVLGAMLYNFLSNSINIEPVNNYFKAADQIKNNFSMWYRNYEEGLIRYTYILLSTGATLGQNAEKELLKLLTLKESIKLLATVTDLDNMDTIEIGGFDQKTFLPLTQALIPIEVRLQTLANIHNLNYEKLNMQAKQRAQQEWLAQWGKQRDTVRKAKSILGMPLGKNPEYPEILKTYEKLANQYIERDEELFNALNDLRRIIFNLEPYNQTYRVSYKRKQEEARKEKYRQAEEETKKAFGGYTKKDITADFKTLGLKKTATWPEVKQAFGALAKQHHPDVLPPEQKAAGTKKFIEIRDAYKRLEEHFEKTKK
jgi:hypothetical protein